MYKLFLPLMFGGLSIIACKKTESVTPESTHSQETHNGMVGDSIVSASKEDSSSDKNLQTGTYTGTVPCASCPGIETTLTLNKDKTYLLEENYLEEKDGKFSEKGSFEVSEDGLFITLNNGTNDNRKKVFFINGKDLFMANKVGDKNMRNEYKLTLK